jgi:acyl-CoA-dependent ceramide synthase
LFQLEKKADQKIGLSVNLLMLLFLTHLCFPRARRHTRKFFELSYYNPESGEYRAGWNDAWMVSYWIVVFTGLRAAVMDYILTPLAKKCGIKTERDQTRFAEQTWLLVYYSVFWSLGMVSSMPYRRRWDILIMAVHFNHI